jgi:long-chain acyl-CoA synthetase
VAIADHAQRTPQKIAVIEAGTGRTLTWAELVGRARATALSWGLAPRSRVAIMLPNSLELVVAGLATVMAQAEWVPINWHLKGEEVAYLLSDSGAAVVVSEPSLKVHVEAALAGAPDVVAHWGVSEEQAAEQSGEWASPSFVFYTSGTTGRPKGVVHGELTPELLGATQDMLTSMWGFTADDVHLLAGPGYHAGPAGYAVTTLWAGGTLVVLPQWDARAAWAAMAQHRVTTTFLTPAHLIRLLEVPQGQAPDLRLVIQSGAPCPVPVKHRFLAAVPQTEVSEMYGASEGGVTRISRADWIQRPGSVGQPWPGVTVRILDADGVEVPPGTEGTIWVQPAGGRRFRYHHDEAKTADTWRDGAFTVGDIGRVDAQGWLYLTDRASDMVIWGGVNIYPREIEAVLHEHPAVIDCAVLGIPHERDGEQLLAVVEAPGATAQELTQHLASHLADFKVPKLIELVETLPRDPNGKVQKRRLREDYLTR